MKKQKGITLIALVITIIIMLILVAVTVRYGIQSGLLSKSKDGAVEYKNKEEEDRIGELRLSYKIDSEIGTTNEKTLKDYLEKELSGEAVVDYTTEGISILYNNSKKPLIIEEKSLNEYGFYYNKLYKAYNFSLGGFNFAEMDVLIGDNKTFKAICIQEKNHSDSVEGSNRSLYDLTFKEALKYEFYFDEEYTAKGTILNEDLTEIYNSNTGYLTTTGLVDSSHVRLSNKKTEIYTSGTVIYELNFSEDGSKLNINQIPDVEFTCN